MYIMIHTILLNSRNLYSGNISNATYLIDWGLLPSNKQFRVRFGFGGGVVNMSTGINSVALLHVDLGQSKVFTTDNTVVRSKTSQCIGVLVPNEQSSSTFMYGDKNLNGPIFLASRPYNNEFSVKISNLTGGAWTDSVGGTVQEYVINLSFEELD
jgi:hypothetical protein